MSSLPLRIGLIADPHFADKAPYRGRFYRDSLMKMRACVDAFNHSNLDFVVELGDLMDSGESEGEELAYLLHVDGEYRKLECERHYVLGNHCVWSLSKVQFYGFTGARASPYSFDLKGRHFIVLDGCFREDEVEYGQRNCDWRDSDIPKPERNWLERDLRETSLPTIVFVHQRLDVEDDYGIKSGPAVRRILEQSTKVTAVFQGHYHHNDHTEIGGIHYITLAAMIEGEGVGNASFAVLEFHDQGRLTLKGNANQRSYEFRVKQTDESSSDSIGPS